MATMRRSITIPDYLRSSVESCTNFSSIVAQLLDENASRLDSGELEVQRRHRKQMAKGILLQRISKLSDEISKKVVEEETSILQHIVNQLENDRKSLDIMSTRLSHIEHQLEKVKLTKKREIREIVNKGIVDTINSILSKEAE
jgi:ABC-type phosphate transport system auxiliary subunit